MPSAMQLRRRPLRDPRGQGAAADPEAIRQRRVRLGIAGGLALLATVVYFRMIVPGHEFIQLEDHRYVIDNPLVHRVVANGLEAETLAEVPKAIVADNWHPLTLLSHLLDARLFRFSAAGHHVTSLLLHAANTALLFYVLVRMTGAVWPSTLAAALFACHPLAVEPVAWIAARKDLLSAFFWLLAMWAYVAYVERPAVGRYVLVSLALLAGLLAKSMLVTFPCVLLLLDYWPLGRSPSGVWTAPEARRGWGWLVREKLPLFALVWLACIVTLVVRWTRRSENMYSAAMQVSQAVQTYYAYLVEAVWPYPLYVPHLTPEDVRWSTAEVVLGALGLVVLVASLVWAGRRRPYLAVGGLWYLGTLVPVLGLVEIGVEAYPDRYAYVPLIGLYIACAWGLDELASRSTWWRRAVSAVAALLVVALAAASWLQLGHWQNTITLFEHTTDHSEDNYTALALLGNGYAQAKRYDESIEAFDRAITVGPNLSQAYLNRGEVLLARGDAARYDFDEAQESFDGALRLGADRHQALVGKATAAYRRRRFDEAEEFAQQALRAKPESVAALVLLAATATHRADAAAAVDWYRQALRIDPGQPHLLINLARIYATCQDDSIRNGASAVELALRANRLTGFNDPRFLDTFAAAYAERRQFREAVETADMGLQVAATAPQFDDDERQELVAAMKEHIELFKLEMPLREPIDLRDPVLP